MRIIPVIDLLSGRAVHAKGGDRAHYAPLRSILHEGSDPEGIALAYRDRIGAREVYIADLDAIAGRSADFATISAICGLGLCVWLDGGTRRADDAESLFDAGSEVVIAGSETLSGPEALAEMIARFGADRVAFSLDLRGGRPLASTSEGWGTDDPRQMAEKAIEVGAGRVIVLDLARVGTGGGVGTEALVARLSSDHPTVELVVGGGISVEADLEHLRRSGARAALVGSALHDGRIGPGAGG